MKAKLSLPHRKFVNRLLAGATAKDAYLHAFPGANANTARSNGSRLKRKSHIQAELAALRQKAESQPDSDFLSYVEIRNYYARVVRAQAATLPDDSDLWNVRKSAKSGLYLRFPDKLRALYLDSKLAGFHPSKSPRHTTLDDSLTQLLARTRNAAPNVVANVAHAALRVNPKPSATRPFFSPASPTITLFSATIPANASLP